MVGRSGRLLNRIISRLTDPTDPSERFSRDEFLIANVVNCQPPNDILTGAPYEQQAIAQCSPFLRETLEKAAPRAILAMGNQSLRWLTGHWGIDSLRGYIHDTKWGPVIGTYHPAYIARGKYPLTRAFQMDLLKAIHVAQGKSWKVEKNYIFARGPAVLGTYVDAYIKEGFPPLAFDIETPYAKIEKDEEIEPTLEDDASFTILRISFAFRDGEAITMPWAPWSIPYIQTLLSSGGDKIVWNQNFDVPRLQANGCEINGNVYDGMEAFHFLEPSLPMGLKFAATFYCPDLPPWKLLSREDPEWYSCADSDAARRVFLAVRKGLEKQGRWNTFVRHYVEFGKILRGMSKQGVLVDKERRDRERQRLEGKYTKLLTELQCDVPDAVKPRKVFKKTQEQLMKIGSWVDGGMVEVTVMEKPKHTHEWVGGVSEPAPWIAGGQPLSLVSCSCGRSKKAPKPKHEHKFEPVTLLDEKGRPLVACACSKMKLAPKPKKERKKNEISGV